MRPYLALALQALLVFAQDAEVADVADVASLDSSSLVGLKTYDAIVVGGGLSGLAAAKKLKAAGKSFVVLEARDRVGGRVHNYYLSNGAPVELGAAFIGPTQDVVISLAAELGLELYPEYDTGNNVLYHNGELLPYPSTGPFGAIPPVDEASLIELVTVQATLDAMAAEFDVQAPWTHPQAAVYDQMTLDDFFVAQNLGNTSRFLLDSAVESIFSVEAHELSLFYALSYVAAAGNSTNPGTLERLTTTSGGAQMWKVNGGTQLLAIKLAQKLGNIVLNSPVKYITKLGSGKSDPYAVTLRNGKTYKGSHVIVAMSPPLAGSIKYSPALPADRVTIQQKMTMGYLGKAIAIYKSPFWRADGLTGQAISDEGVGRVTYEQAPAGASANTWGGIMAFLEADTVRKYMSASDSEIASLVKKDFVRYFGAKAKDVVEWVITIWNREEFSRGGPTAIAAPGFYAQNAPALRKRVGNLHFAGTESSDYWVGYMDGALRSGARAAAEVL